MTTRTAVVLGASIAGLLAARALSLHFSRVVILERDTFTPETLGREGTPQDVHPHVLLRRGLREIQVLCPGFRERLIAGGAVSSNAGDEWYALFPQGLLARHHSDTDILCASRGLMERALRDEVCELPNVRLRTGMCVVDVELDSEGPPAVTLQPVGGSGRAVLVADLCVDATGRHSELERWLEASGFGPVPRSEIRPFLVYATRRYRGVRLPEGYRAVLSMPRAPDQPCGGMVMPIEGGEHIVTLLGFSQKSPPEDEVGFESFARRLRSPLVSHVLRTAQAVSSIQVFRQREYVFRHYDQLGTWPQGLVAIGDGVCSLNPLYSQGMTSAALAAWALERVARRGQGSEDWARSAQQAINAVYVAPWEMASREDSRWPGTEGARTGLRDRTLLRYLDRINRAATRDPAVADAYLDALHMCRSPASLLAPRLLAKAWLHGGAPAGRA